MNNTKPRSRFDTKTRKQAHKHTHAIYSILAMWIGRRPAALPAAKSEGPIKIHHASTSPPMTQEIFIIPLTSITTTPIAPYRQACFRQQKMLATLAGVHLSKAFCKFVKGVAFLLLIVSPLLVCGSRTPHSPAQTETAASSFNTFLLFQCFSFKYYFTAV